MKQNIKDVIANDVSNKIISLIESGENTHCIVCHNDKIIESNLTLSQAETKLCYYINMGEDYYIVDMKDFT